VNVFHVFGPILAAWAVLVSVLGITREGFPSTSGAVRLVGAISVVLTILAIGSAIYAGATEEDKGEEGGTAVVLPI
jgi:hypothetical protein